MSEYETTSNPDERTLSGKAKTILVHRKVWIEKYGKIPKGYVIHHKNGNKKDNRIENLECLSFKEHAKRHRLPNRIRIIYPNGAVKVLKKD